MTVAQSLLFFETIRAIYLLCAVALCLTVVIAANRMSRKTCNCQKTCLILILIGATAQLVLATSSVLTLWGMMAGIPVSAGLAFKLAIDRRQQCEASFHKVPQ